MTTTPSGRWRPRTQPPSGHRAAPPGPGQESVWDYPRPPAVERTDRHVVVRLGAAVVADTRRALRVLETSHPPAFYLPAEDFADGALVAVDDAPTWCEYKGRATYLDVAGVDADGASVVVRHAAWTYPEPSRPYRALVGHVALYPGRMTACTVDGEVVRPQAGGFYGGWVTDDVVGPFKGETGTRGW